MFWSPQPGPQVLAVTCPADEVLFGGSRGGGKAQPLDAIVMTPFGPSTMGEMAVGKQVLNPDGTTARVIAVHERGILPTYQIQLTGGFKCLASADHLWLLESLRVVTTAELHPGDAIPRIDPKSVSKFFLESVVSINFVGEQECRCITVDHPNGLYLTDDFIVTHNSDTTIGRHLYGAQQYEGNWNGLVVRRKYKDLNEIRRRWDELISAGLPAERVGGENQTNYVRFANGAQVALMAFQRIEQLDDIQGHQYPEISVEECTNFPWFNKLMDKLSGANRSPHGIPTHIFCTGNPGGPGHLQVKDYFRLGSNGLPSGKVWNTKQKLSRVYIQSFLKDNQILCKNDPKYVNRLTSISDPVLRRAWLDGNWDVYIGQAFSITSRHIVKPAGPPPGVALYMTMDWGFGAPFSIGWWWVDPNSDRITRFNEWYGWNGVPNEGLRLEDSKIAEGILEREQKMGINGRPIIRLAGPDCWNKKADYRGGGQGPSTAEVFRDKGVILRPGDPARLLKIRAFRERLIVSADEDELPKMQICSNCKQFLRTVPALAMGEDDTEDLDDDQEDHIYDEACHIVMARSRQAIEVSGDSWESSEKARKRAGLPKSHSVVWSELDKIREDLDSYENF